jgi:hypothetical protein
VLPECKFNRNDVYKFRQRYHPHSHPLLGGPELIRFLIFIILCRNKIAVLLPQQLTREGSGLKLLSVTSSARVG